MGGGGWRMGCFGGEETVNRENGIKKWGERQTGRMELVGGEEREDET